jgi:hypothetical protein
MANTMTLISSVTLSSAQANIDFTSIPATYTDLLIKTSARCTYVGSGQNYIIKFNNSTTGYTLRYLEGDGASAASGTSPGTFTYLGAIGGTTYPANIFNTVDIYIPNYASSNYKSFSVDDAIEANTTTAYAGINAELWSNTAAINQITLYAGAGNLATYSTAYLYGIKNS